MRGEPVFEIDKAENSGHQCKAIERALQDLNRGIAVKRSKKIDISVGPDVGSDTQAADQGRSTLAHQHAKGTCIHSVNAALDMNVIIGPAEAGEVELHLPVERLRCEILDVPFAIQPIEIGGDVGQGQLPEERVIGNDMALDREVENLRWCVW